MKNSTTLARCGKVIFPAFIFGAWVATLSAQSAPATGLALVRHGPTINGPVDGSVRQMLGEDAKLNSGGSMTGDLFVPGTPVVAPASNVNYGGTIDGTGSTSPSNYKITLGSGVSLRHVVRRTDPIPLPTVPTPPAPSATKDVSVNTSTQTIDWSNVRNLTLNSNVGPIAVPAGTYGKLTAAGGTAFVLGVAGAIEPAVYNLQQLTLNSSGQLRVCGPVIVNVAGNVTFACPAGVTDNLSWLQLNIASGDLTLNSQGAFYGYVTAPAGTVVLNSTSWLTGGVVVRWTPKVGHRGSLTQTQENDPHVEETSSAQCPVQSPSRA